MDKSSRITGSTNLTLNAPIGSGLVYLTCTNAPAKASCSVDTANTINSHVADFRSNPQDQATVHVTTTANTAANSSHAYSAWAMMLGTFIFLPISRRIWSRHVALIGNVLAILISTTAFQSCGGGSGTVGSGGGGTNGTPTGHYTLTITAYTVSGDTSTANVTLNVN